MAENIDHENLKKRGFLRQKQEGFFVFRSRMSSGVYSQANLQALGQISREFGRGFVHVTVRQGIEIPFISLEKIPEVEARIKAAGIENGTSGARLRATTVCPGNNWCRQGLINTFELAEIIEKELGLKCGLELPHKFKIAISGCPNTCTRAQNSEIGIHPVSSGFVLYLGGCAGRNPRSGLKIEKTLNQEELLSVIKNTVNFFKLNAKPRQRLASLIDETGKEKFLGQVSAKVND